MNELAKIDIRRKALRAAAGVALFTGTIACGEGPTQSLEPQLTPVVTHTDSGVEIPIPDPVDSGPVDIGFADSGLADAGHADTGVADAGGGPLVNCPDAETDFNAWNECCFETVEASDGGITWSEAGCLAWGPPVPPTLEVA